MLFSLFLSLLNPLFNHSRVLSKKVPAVPCETQKKVEHKKYEELEKVLLKWFQLACIINFPVNGGGITEKAKQIAERLNITEFCGSTGWLDQFPSRHGIVNRQISGEAGSVIDDDSASWKDNVLLSFL